MYIDSAGPPFTPILASERAGEYHWLLSSVIGHCLQHISHTIHSRSISPVFTEHIKHQGKSLNPVRMQAEKSHTVTVIHYQLHHLLQRDKL